MILRDELHLHLYGCVTAHDLHEMGKDRWRKVPDRLQWYETEYAKAYGRRPDAAAYWTAPDGEARLKADYEFTAPAPFPRFQACFNLLIALFPIAPEDTVVLRHVLRTQRSQGVRYGEYRSYIPPHLTPQEAGAYVTAYAAAAMEVEDESAGAYTPRLAFGLARASRQAGPANSLGHHAAVRAALAARPALARVVTGLDFCGVEEGYPPSTMPALFAAIHQANRETPERALAILYHVGESFQDMSMASAIRWVAEAHAMGAHRLGHAIALGLSPEGLAATHPAATERAADRLEHLDWLAASRDWLAAHGYTFDAGEVRAERERLAGLDPRAPVEIAHDAAALAAIRRLQDAVLARLAETGAIVESCPTSNFRIGRIADAAHHPLPRFLAAGLKTVVSTDDPGIFGITLGDEEAVCRAVLGLGSPALAQIQKTNESCRAAHLVR